MQPYNLSTGAEALRWLGIAEKLLQTRDLVGSKTFATRARESDPRLEHADQILAIADTLIAGENQISNHHLDWYAILQLSRRTHDSELIASQYRRLALLLNPNRNKFPFAEHAFKLVSDAWLVLSNPSRKFQFDNEFGNSNNTHFNFIQQHHEPPQLNNSTHFNFIQEHSEHLHQSSPMQQQQQQFLQPFPQQQLLSPQQLLPQQQPQAFNLQQQHHIQSLPQQQPRTNHSQQHLPRPQPQQPLPRPQPQQSLPRPQPQQPLSQPQPQQPMPIPQPQKPSPKPQSQKPSLQPQPQKPPAQPQPQKPPAQPQPQLQKPSAQPQPQKPSPQPQSQSEQPLPQPQPQELGESGSLRNGNDNIIEEENGDNDNNADYDVNVEESSSFWTACPYCYNMYEYPRAYAECTLRCQNCKRAFHAVKIAAPPPTLDGKDAYFCCWGFFPLGVSMSYLEKNKNGVSNWTPFSTMFAFPQGQSSMNVGKPNNARKSSGPRIYIDDDQEVFVDLSTSDEDTDDEWGSTRKKKKTKSAKRKGSAAKNIKQPRVDKAKKAKVGNGENSQGGVVAQEGVDVGVPNVAVPNVLVGETSKKAAVVNIRKQPGRVAKDLGKLDLNVEFSNEVEEPAPGTSEGNKAGNGVEDNIEGIGFFEGLDEFLNSLPILNVVADDKVKAG